jgi:hypothetical protein
MPPTLATKRVECLKQIRLGLGRICGAHLREDQTWCPVCGEPTTTRPLESGGSPLPDPGAQAPDGNGRRPYGRQLRIDVLYLESRVGAGRRQYRR